MPRLPVNIEWGFTITREGLLLRNKNLLLVNLRSAGSYQPASATSIFIIMGSDSGSSYLLYHQHRQMHGLNLEKLPVWLPASHRRSDLKIFMNNDHWYPNEAGSR